jgi:hypothetical protein
MRKDDSTVNRVAKVEDSFIELEMRGVPSTTVTDVDDVVFSIVDDDSGTLYRYTYAPDHVIFL